MLALVRGVDKLPIRTTVLEALLLCSVRAAQHGGGQLEEVVNVDADAQHHGVAEEAPHGVSIGRWPGNR